MAARLALFVIIGLTFPLLFGCAPGKESRKWSEEVDLGDGRLITIDRYVQFQASNSLAGDAYNATETRSTISFRSELSALPKWDVPLVPILLYQDASSGAWAIVATTSSCEVWSGRGSPQPPYWEFRLIEDRWQEAPISAKSFDQQSNLFFDYNGELPAKHITSSLTKHSRAEIGVGSKYKVISAGAKTNCM
jgi:hypothetical protein